MILLFQPKMMIDDKSGDDDTRDLRCHVHRIITAKYAGPILTQYMAIRLAMHLLILNINSKSMFTLPCVRKTRVIFWRF